MRQLKYILISFIFLLNFKSFSQIDEFSDWIGEWYAVYDNNIGTKNEEHLTIKWAHLNRWLQFDIVGGSNDNQFKYSSSMVLTLDDNFNIVGWYIDNSGYSNMSKVNGVIEDGKIIIEVINKKWTSKSTLFMKEGKLHNKGKSKYKQTGETFSNEIIYTRKQ